MEQCKRGRKEDGEGRRGEGEEGGDDGEEEKGRRESPASSSLTGAPSPCFDDQNTCSLSIATWMQVQCIMGEFLQDAPLFVYIEKSDAGLGWSSMVAGELRFDPQHLTQKRG
jgi:hypothetical protein